MDRDDNVKPETLSWVIDIEDRLNRGLPPDVESRRTIYRVPSNLRGVHNSAFDPEMLGIGPFNKPWEREESFSRLRVMEEHKLWFLNRLLEGKLERHRRDKNMQRTTEAERVSDDRQRNEDDDGGRIAKAKLLKGLEKAVWTLEKEIKACYSLNVDEGRYFCVRFAPMMVIDGCFVVELLRINYDLLHGKIDWSATEDDPIFTNDRILIILRRDLLLLENQLPFFLLEKLYEVINKKNNIDHQRAVPLEVLAVTFFETPFAECYEASDLDAGKPKAHLLEVFRSTFLQSVSEKVPAELGNRSFRIKKRIFLPNKKKMMITRFEHADRSMDLHFASELEEAGVRFEKRKGHDLLDIEFRKRTLRVPPLSLDDNNISLLLNMVAYEQSANHPKPFFTNYLTFWGRLVNSPRDIQVLHKHGIINNMGNEADVAKLLMRCREIICDFNLGYLCDAILGVNEYCERYYESRCRVWWRSLIRERFSSPWTCLSLFAAIILLLLTLLQTVYTVFSYYWKN